MGYQMITPRQLIEKFRQALDEKWGYVWGKSGDVWTERNQQAIETSMTKKYGPDWKKNKNLGDDHNWMTAMYASKWVDHKVADCSGLFYWAFKQLGSYTYHGSNTMFKKYCMAKGELRNGRRTDIYLLKPGTALFTGTEESHGHVGLYIGNDTVIEAAGTKQGVITSKVSNKKWTWWGELKYVDYDAEETDMSKNTENKVSLTYPTLRYGDKGEAVTQLQDLLSKSGSTLSVDGVFGVGTRSAVRAFQSRNGLDVDGIVGPKTWAKLLEVAGNIKTGDSEGNEEQQVIDEDQLTLEQKVAIMWAAFAKEHTGEDGLMHVEM